MLLYTVALLLKASGAWAADDIPNSTAPLWNVYWSYGNVFQEGRWSLCHACTNLCPIMGNQKSFNAMYQTYQKEVPFGSSIFKYIARNLV